MPSKLFVPSAIEAVIQEFEHAEVLFTEFDVQEALSKARQSLQYPSDAENYGAWAEVLGFTLVGNRRQKSPWNTFFGPIGSETAEDGSTVYFPDITCADEQIVAHWINRATTVEHPILKGRYAHLAWDMSAVIPGTRRDPEMSRLAIDAYVTSIPLRKETHDRFEAALCALDLAAIIHDQKRTELARSVLLHLHRDVINTKKGPWWLTFDRLINDKRIGVTEQERNQLIEDLEELILYYGDTSDAERFEPRRLQGVAERLIKHYRRCRQHNDVKRLHEAIAYAFEYFAKLVEPMVASSVLQTAVNAYQHAGLPDDAKRVRIAMQDQIRASHDHLGVIQTEATISDGDMETFIDSVVADNMWETFARIAIEFLPRRRKIEEQLELIRVDAPLHSDMPFDVITDDHVVCKIGSIDDDPAGRLVWQTDVNVTLNSVWLERALDYAIETHKVMPEHFVAWANRLSLFDDLTFLTEGITAWYNQDFDKAIHLLVPQIEYGLRSIAAKLDRPVTKPSREIPGVSIAIGMGDILYSDELREILGPDIVLYFLAIYADPRGKNLRNRIAHGLIKPKHVDGHLVRLLIHSLLVFGIWRELAQKRR